jgi:hypothetical protein
MFNSSATDLTVRLPRCKTFDSACSLKLDRIRLFRLQPIPLISSNYENSEATTTLTPGGSRATALKPCPSFTRRTFLLSFLRVEFIRDLLEGEISGGKLTKCDKS